MTDRDCTKCDARLVWDPAANTWVGTHLDWCPIATSKASNARPSSAAPSPTNEVGLEDVIGPTGKPEWSVTASTGRSVGGHWITDTFHVRAVTRDGALLLAKEVRPYIRDAVAVLVSNPSDDLLN